MSIAEALDVQEQLRRQLLAKFDDDVVVNDDGLGPVPQQGRLADDMPLMDYAKLWFVHVDKTGRKRPHVVDADLHRAERLILPQLGHLYIGDIGKPELSVWMDRLPLLVKDNGEPYAKATLKSAWRLLATMLRDAELLIGVRNTSPDHMRFRVNAPTVRPKDTLTRDELGALLAASEPESPDIRAMVWLAGTTGMRFGEVTALTWDDVDFDRGLIRITKSQVEGKVFPTKTSTNRTVPLFGVVADILVEHKAWLEQQSFNRIEGLVFPSRKGTYRMSSVTRGPLRRCAERAGIDKRVTNQALRRTVNNLIRQTAGEIAARAITGHATQDMTEHYSDVTLQEKMTAGEAAFGSILVHDDAQTRARGVDESGEPKWGTSHSGAVPHLPTGRGQNKTPDKIGG